MQIDQSIEYTATQHNFVSRQYHPYLAALFSGVSLCIRGPSWSWFAGRLRRERGEVMGGNSYFTVLELYRILSIETNAGKRLSDIFTDQKHTLQPPRPLFESLSAGSFGQPMPDLLQPGRCFILCLALPQDIGSWVAATWFSV